MDRRKSTQFVQLTDDVLDQLPARLVLERIPVPSLAIARDGRILFANEAFAEMLGYSTEDVLAMDFSKLFRES